ncbi:hypothetical protein XELAEV_18005103mg [Xenopus laevis]|uniref:Uncharacterized protein n=1 Tax=Xenopus laevis TaxID=8355 RepID=A0A974DXZ0_XENLA|nr:hypothetical protein XELAEV_18005103mg [Xenopus laevis]
MPLSWGHGQRPTAEANSANQLPFPSQSKAIFDRLYEIALYFSQCLAFTMIPSCSAFVFHIGWNLLVQVQLYFISCKE